MKKIILLIFFSLSCIESALSADLTKEEKEQFAKEFCGTARSHFLPEDKRFTASNVELVALQHWNPDDRCLQNIEQEDFDNLYLEVKKSAATSFKDSKSSFEVMVKFELTTSNQAAFEMKIKDVTEADMAQIKEFKSSLKEIKEFHSTQGVINIAFHYKIEPASK
jgi:hypothetical protein